MVRGHDERAQVGERCAAQARLAEQVLDEAQDLDAPAASGDGVLDAAAVEHGADPVAAPGEQPGERRHEVDEDRPLEAIGVDGAEVHRGAEVEQEPRGDLAILVVLADVRRVHPGGDVPVDVPDVVAGLVLAQRGEVDAVAVEQAPVVALKQAIQPADDLPVEALEDALRR